MQAHVGQFVDKIQSPSGETQKNHLRVVLWEKSGRKIPFLRSSGHFCHLSYLAAQLQYLTNLYSKFRNNQTRF